MKILFVQKEGGIFGAENYQLKAIPGLLEKGLQIEFLRLYTDYQGGEGGEFIKKLGDLGVKTHEVNIGRFPSYKKLKKIQAIANSGNYDLVHTHLIHADIHLALIKRFMRLDPVLVSTKHGYDNKFTSQHGFDSTKQTNTLYFLTSRWAEKIMDRSFTISNGLRNFFIETGLTRPEKMRLIHYGFSMPNYFEQKGQDEFRRGAKQIIMAGRLVAFKGHKFLLEAMLKLKEHYQGNIKLLIAGSGGLEDELTSLVDKRNLNDVVDFLGYSKEVGIYMANSDVVVVPSVSEGFGVVFLEAFAAQTPVVAWNVSAANELIEDGHSGYLAKPYDTDDLASKIIEGLESKDNVQLNAYKRLTEYFNLNRMLEETIQFYEDSLNSKKT